MSFKNFLIIIAAIFVVSLITFKLYAAEAPKLDLNQIYKQSKEIAVASAKHKLDKLQNEEVAAFTAAAKVNDNIRNIFKQDLPANSSCKDARSIELGDLPQQGELLRELGPEQMTKKKQNSCTKDNCNVASVFSTTAINKRTTESEKFGFRKNKDNFTEHNKGYIDTANAKIKEFAKKNNAIIAGSTDNCTPFYQEFNYQEQHQCERYFDVKHDNCSVSQIVEIDSKYTYLCNKKRQEAVKTCHDTITSISCNKSNECDGGGLIRSSFAGEISWDYTYPTLRVGTVGDNSICGNCRTLDKRTEFEIKNLAKLTEFTLLELHYDDYLWIQLNGHNIFIGPETGDRIEVIGNVVSTGSRSKYSCERGKSHHHLGINRDLRPYLKEGKNVLFTRLIVSGCGEFWMYIRARQHCCKDWNITREEKCEFDGVGS